MARLRQQNPGNYTSSGNISNEFENLVRYLVAAEFGNKTLGELLDQLFDDNGEWEGPIEMRLDTSAGLQFRVGTYTDETSGWQTIVALEDIRGASGLDVGTLGAPILYSRQDSQPAASATVVAYAHDDTDELLVYVDGVLQVEGGSNDYTHDADDDEVTFTSPFAGTETVSIYKIRADAITNFLRSDTTTVATQSVFPFVHDDDTVLQVYKNGILQREGGAYDYTTSPASDTVTFTSPVTAGNLVSIITVENTSSTTVTGLMTESNFTDLATGLILFSKLGIEDGDIAQAKVSGLTDHIASAAKLSVSGTSPVSPTSGDLWMDTSTSPNILKFYDGTQWLETSPESGLPTFTTADANKNVRVNGTGTALEYATPDYSSLVAQSEKGAANGVASLDSDGKLPQAQLPDVLASLSIYDLQSGAVANGSFDIQRIFKQRVEIVGVSLQSSAGTCTWQLEVDGVAVGDTQSVSTTPNHVTFGTAQQIDATSASAKIGFEVTSQSSLADLEVTLAVQILSD